MRDFSTTIFLTLVAASLLCLHPSFSDAAPNDNLNPSRVREPIQDVNDPSLIEASLRNRKEDEIIQFTGSWLTGRLTNKISDQEQVALGLTYDWKDFDQNYWSLSGRWLNAEVAWLEIGKKFMIFPENMYEPYYKISLSHFMDPSDALAGFSRIDSFKMSLSAGFLDLWTLGRILNCEIGIHWGIPGTAFHAQAGAQWSF